MSCYSLKSQVAVDPFIALTSIFNERSEVLKALPIKTQFFQDIARGPDDENSTLLRNVGQYLRADTAKHSRRFES